MLTQQTVTGHNSIELSASEVLILVASGSPDFTINYSNYLLLVNEESKEQGLCHSVSTSFDEAGQPDGKVKLYMVNIRN